jgi:exonuclease SbcC
MITLIRLANFRRHADLELRFDDAGQIILVAGRNGVGKTTLLEAITYGLYAEGRHGRRNLDQLLRRGAELEGMEVELAFTIGEDRYRVLRRRDGRSSTAVLYANDHPLVEGQREVTEEITRVLGMDSSGFRLATIAQQKDLDGLASLTPTTRSRMITRLLRLDALTRARDAASEMHHSEAKVAAQLRPLQPLETFELEHQQACKSLADAQTELDRTSAAVSELRDRLDADVTFLAEWKEIHDRLSLAGAELAIAEADRQRLAADLSQLILPDEPTDRIEDLSVLADEVAGCERDIAAAELSRTNTEHRRSVETELALVSARIEELATTPDVAACSQALDIVQAEYTAISAQHESLERQLAEILTVDEVDRLAEHDLEMRIQRADGLGADCESCGQIISDDHRHNQSRSLLEQLENLRATVAPRRARLEELRSSRVSLDNQLTRCADEVSAARTALEQSGRDDVERKDLQRRRDTYLDQIERLPAVVVDIDSLYARKADLALRVARSQAAAAALQERSTALQLQAQTRSSLTAAEARVDAAHAAVVANTPNEEMQQNYRVHEQARTALVAEEQLLSFNVTETAVAQERVTSAETALVRSRAEDERRRRHQTVALNAGNAKRLLSDVADRLSTTVRPALEGAVANLLSTMSEGRFSKVSISEDYEIRVEDDGRMRALNELSGGESDLVALATRLALAQIVRDRHGSGGAGFLILDEPLGSQDPVRRQSVLNGLRSLRSSYDQIFLISHFDGIEDAADTVVHISASEDRLETVVEVT